MEFNYDPAVLARIGVEFFIFAGMLFLLYLRSKQISGQSAIDKIFEENSKFDITCETGETTRVWTTKKNGTIPSHLYIEANCSPAAKFTCNTKRALSSLQPWDLIPRGHIVHLGTEVDSRAKLRTSDPAQVELHFVESKRRQALTDLLEAGFNSITADGIKLMAVKDNFVAPDLDPPSLKKFVDALCALK